MIVAGWKTLFGLSSVGREGRMGLVIHSDTGQIKLLMATYRKFAPAA